MQSTAELLKKIRLIELKTRGLSRNIFSGEYHSAFKGRGMTFSEVREYQIGDDVRAIDWNVTARFNKPFIKVFEEERELTFMLLIDISGSLDFGTRTMTKKSLLTEISAVLAFSAIQNNDKVGVILFSNKIEKFIPPKKGRSHILRIIRELLTFKPEESGTNLTEALRYFNNVIKKRSTAFIISDFKDKNYEDALKIAKNKHDIMCVRLSDEAETKLPPIGLVQFSDPETGKLKWINTNSKKIRENFEYKALLEKEYFNKLMLKNGIDSIDLQTNQPYIKPLIQIFKKREKML